jgi:hypothetical protein
MNLLGESQDFNIPQGLALSGKAFFHGLTDGPRVVVAHKKTALGANPGGFS